MKTEEQFCAGFCWEGCRGQASRPIPNYEYQLINSKYWIPNIKHQILICFVQDVFEKGDESLLFDQYRIPNNKYRIQNTEHRIPKTNFVQDVFEKGDESLLFDQYQIPNTEYQTPDTEYRIPKYRIPKTNFVLYRMFLRRATRACSLTSSPQLGAAMTSGKGQRDRSRWEQSIFKVFHNIFQSILDSISKDRGTGQGESEVFFKYSKYFPKCFKSISKARGTGQGESRAFSKYLEIFV